MIDVGAVLRSLIYLISSSLLYPAMLLLTVLVVRVLVFSGSFIGEALSRSSLRCISGLELSRRDLTGDLSDVCSYHVRGYLKTALQAVESGSVMCETLLEDLLRQKSAELWKSLDQVRILVRIGPGLGLIGTLIPMGTGLAALGQGDVTKLSSDLVIAFTTTVVGLAVGLTSYFFYWKKKRWVEEDIRRMEFLTELLVGRPGGKEGSHAVHEAGKTALGR
ncbi:MAG: MotA/TolQ/ExbB proton channel family protein [Desulfomonilaceae bacterium]|nr:MotA/TolQ/ExbB proton channel family protein [Desulfomonilaceae bacterium]